MTNENLMYVLVPGTVQYTYIRREVTGYTYILSHRQALQQFNLGVSSFFENLVNLSTCCCGPKLKMAARKVPLFQSLFSTFLIHSPIFRN